MAVAAREGGAAIKRVVVIGAGLAGLAAATSLVERGFKVTVLERKSIPGGRASSYDAQDTGETVDNCQHILMRCCTNLWQFYGQAGVQDRIRWIDRIHFMTPDGQVSQLGGSRLPAPFHLMPSFFRLKFLSPADKWSVANAMLRMLPGAGPAKDLAFSDWLRSTRQTPRAVSRFWRPIIVSALNEEPERCSTRYAFQVIRQGFLGHSRAYEMGVPRVPLRELYSPCVESLRKRGADVEFRSGVGEIVMNGPRATAVRTAEGEVPADYVVSAVAFGSAREILPLPVADQPFFRQWASMAPAPISAVHFWWDREVTRMEHAALLDREVQWMFNKTPDFGRPGDGTYMGLVVSASYDWLRKSRRDILELAEREIRETFPGTRGASITKSAVIKEALATYSPAPGIDALRPTAETPVRNLMLAGDWTQNGWPSTMEAAVRGGYLAAEAVLAAEGRPETLRAADLPWQPLVGR